MKKHCCKKSSSEEQEGKPPKDTDQKSALDNVSSQSSQWGLDSQDNTEVYHRGHFETDLPEINDEDGMELKSIIDGHMTDDVCDVARSRGNQSHLNESFTTLMFKETESIAGRQSSGKKASSLLQKSSDKTEVPPSMNSFNEDHSDVLEHTSDAFEDEQSASNNVDETEQRHPSSASVAYNSPVRHRNLINKTLSL